MSGFRFLELGISFLVNGVKIPCFHYSLFTIHSLTENEFLNTNTT